MTTQTTEQRFQAFKQQLSVDNFNSIEFLTAKAQQLEASDPELSQRILVRVTNLKKAEQNRLDLAPRTKEVATEQKTIKLTRVERLKKALKIPFVLLVILPTLVFGLYQSLWTSERYVSRAKVIIQQPDGMATMDASMALLSGLGMSNTGVADTELVKAYIFSNDMLTYLNEQLDLIAHYSQSSIDRFSRIGEQALWEDIYDYYLSRIDIYIDSSSNIVNIESQAFDPDFAHQLTQAIVERAEWYINSIGHQLANAQLEFILNEYKTVEQKLESAQTNLLNFQQRYNLLDPMAEGLAMQQITYALEGQITAKEAELRGLMTMMSPNAPQVVVVKNTLNALKNQLDIERSKLSDNGRLTANGSISNSENKAISVSEILAQYTDLKVKMELALQSYTASQISLEKSRIEAYRQLKYLVVVEASTKPHDAKYPNVLYNVVLFAVLASMLFVTGRIVLLTIQELR